MMEKYTVDIDKVLDEFEQSEALQVSQKSECSFANENNPICDFRKTSFSNEQLQNCQTNDQQTIFTNICLQSKINNSLGQSHLQYLNEVSISNLADEDKTSALSESSLVQFHASGITIPVDSEKCSNIKNQVLEKDEPNSKNCIDSSTLNSAIDSACYSIDEPISLQVTADCFKNSDINLSSTDSYSENRNTIEFSETEDNKFCQYNRSVSPIATASQVSVSANHIFLSNDNQEVIEAASNIIDLENDHSKTAITRVPSQDYSRSISCKIPISRKASKNTQDTSAVSFSENEEEPVLSIEEMNEYLNDFSNNDGQDRDSGLSCQEEINGNNQVLTNSNSVNATEKKSQSFDNEAKSLYPYSLRNEHSIDFDATIISNPAVPFDLPEHESCLSNTEEASQSSPVEDTYNSKSFIEDVNFFNCKFGEENSNILTSGTEATEIQQCSDLEPDVANVLCEVINKDNSEESIADNTIQSQKPEMKLVFSPNDGTFRSVPTSDIKSKSNLSTSNNNFIYDSHSEETVASPCSPSFTSRLQRPTTLNLSCHNTGTTNIVTSSSDLASASTEQPAEEVPPSHLLIEASHMEHSEIETPASKLGTVKPFWIPDSEASNCMHCRIKFTVIKRRHHCRACGKVLCSRCCSQRARLPYLLNKEDRVCQQCIEHLNYIEAEREKEDSENRDSPIPSSCGSSPSFSQSSVSSNLPPKDSWRPHPNNPDDYCSTVSPLQQVEELANRPPPTVMVPIGVLKRGNKPRGEPKQVIFSDGIRPGGDLTDLTETVDIIPPSRRHTRRRDKFSIGEDAYLNISSEAPKKKVYNHKNRHKRIVVSDNDGPLPPILLPNDSETAGVFDLHLLFSKLQDDDSAPVIFAVTKNMHVWTKITKLDCCFGKECWCFTSHGLCTVGQDEVLLLLERFQDEDIIPRDVFKVFSKIYDDASKGVTVGELGHLIFPDGIFGSWEHRGFLFVRPTFQCLSKLVLPNTPYLFGILIQKWEVPWAKVFPLRLMLRLGAECRYYPCSLVSIRFRKPVYFEIGQTIMSLLADLRNFQFTIPFIPGLVVHMEEKKTYVNIPRNRYDKLMKVLNSNNVEHVLALGCNFSPDADSHLVCMQREEGDYQAQAINIENTTRKVTGASFIVFSEALKSATGLSAKFKIVEDGLLVEIPQETMVLLHSALRDMRDLTIQCKQINATEPEEVNVQWISDDRKFNIGVTSPVDNRNLEGTSSLRIHTSTDYAGNNYLIRWTEVFFLDGDKTSNTRRVDAIDPCRIAETVAQAFCMALIPYLDSLAEVKMTKLGLRITLDAKKDMVEYDVGSLGQNLPAMYMNALDNSLIPVLSRITLANQVDPTALELIFYILMK